MTNVMFKRGLSKNLPTTGVNGTFYLTTDTNRLYVANEQNALVELNQSINTVVSLGQLPTGTTGAQKGQYYYVSNDNVLAYYDGTQWKQINPDATIKDSKQNTTAVQTGDIVTLTSTVEDTEGHTSKSVVNYTGSDAVDVSVATVTNTDSGDVITVTIDAHDTKYDLTSDSATIDEKVAAKLVLGSDVASDSDASVAVYGGTNITVENTEKGIKISAANAANMYNTEVSEAFDSNGKHTTSVTDGDGTETSKGVIPTVAYGNGKTAVFIQEFESDGKTAKGNPTAVLDIYDKEQVNSLISMADAMHYMGTVSKTDAATKLVLAKAQNGDTYKVSSAFDNINGISAKTGDLVIAKGTEDPVTGKITTGTWEVIPSGDSQVVSATASENNNKLTINDNAADPSSKNIGSIQLLNGDDDDINYTDNISVTSDVANNTNDLVTTIKHRGPSAAKAELKGSQNDVTQAAASEASFEAITNLSYDINGHIVSASTNTFKVVDTHNHLTEHTYTTSGGSNTAIGTAVVITNTVTTTDDGPKPASITLDSDTLQLVQSNNTVSIDMVWGTF